ncbi:hypothetical protein AB7M49_004293 [Bradyrhizobium elkanii]
MTDADAETAFKAIRGPISWAAAAEILLSLIVQAPSRLYAS